MNVSDYIYLLHHPSKIDNEKMLLLEKIIAAFPYFQSARSLYLKGLFDQDSFKYNQALKETAIYTTDRTVLFDFITSEFFSSPVDFEKKDSPTVTDNIIKKNWESKDKSSVTHVDTLKESIINTIKGAAITIIEEQKRKEVHHKEALNLGKPLYFSKKERYSFEEWLSLTQSDFIDKKEYKSYENVINTEESHTIKNEGLRQTGTQQKDLISSEKQRKLDLIDRFIMSNPKIVPNKTITITNNLILERNSQDPSHLMTETLAKVYLEQKKYQKAIQAYDILMLKYPEKSSYFASQIENVKILQQNNH